MHPVEAGDTDHTAGTGTPATMDPTETATQHYEFNPGDADWNLDSFLFEPGSAFAGGRYNVY